ncbi:M15 family metallopeptidase [Aeromicrobium alkaliterrae]|uniref:M15 family metallopeptidase n=1 Tax=Aeromicrobium alkaliterrae TaxID=302168 RepID=A0ABP4VK18_9ACTN
MTLVLLVLVGLLATAWLLVRTASTGSPLPGNVSLTGDDGGAIPDEGVPVSATDVVGVARLDPELLAAVQQAAADAAADGVELRITSGWRSKEYQQQLLDDATQEYGQAAARRLVQSPERSRHTSGDAVDIGPTDAAFWVLRHGSDYGLCQVYANEVWHYELLTEPGGTCPPLQADAS